MRPGRRSSALFAILAAAGVAACACAANHAKSPTETPPTPTAVSTTPPTVTTFDEVKANAGALVRATGTVQREKMGDTLILSDGLDLLCPDLRLPDDVTEATLEGTLELWEPPVASVDDQGQISQGVEEGTTRWVLRGCKRI